ncbi:Aste57867_24921 [Aphanomyces stellatus]|uniref:Aste57867_24921 protein n=1 Tax=Aphanomyces stellatus TaxID=120398 RepID=A0A485LRQ6_9STRA|nr:hypothetical protein As57867_024843 [Aphanomyces stellatus]VFU01553.1 Aste57867_24921 [Aphanomyces stellatus]
MDLTRSNFPNDAVHVTYIEFNFKGQRQVTNKAMLLNQTRISGIKSYQLLPKDQLEALPPLYVGCFPADIGLDLKPIYMQPGEGIASLTYPWNYNFANVTKKEILKESVQRGFKTQSWMVNGKPACIRCKFGKVKSLIGLAVWRT